MSGPTGDLPATDDAATVGALRRRVVELEQELAEVPILVRDRERAAAEATRLRAERDARAAVSPEHAEELRAAASRAEVLEQQLARVEARLAELESSTSWRVTAPLRRVAGVRRRS